ncbi:MAG: sel1 repeat family protein [Rhizobiales bacterium]|nr:sel1 repeat family protein [Hyphomicrobiales bacterium]
MTIWLRSLAVAGMLGAHFLTTSGALAEEVKSPNPPQPAATSKTPPNTDAILRLADLYATGDAVPLNYGKAYELYAQAAAAGSLTAKLRMGEMLARGQGAVRDVTNGRKLVRELAEAGNTSAWVSLGDLYARGDAGPMNPREAIKAYEAAVAQGSKQAMMRLGDIYRLGRFAAPQPDKAKLYYRKAADAGEPYGLLLLGILQSNQSTKKVSREAAATQVLRQAEKAGLDYAIVSIASNYFYGKSAPQDPKRALALLVAAAKAGNTAAISDLIASYRTGRRDGRLLLVKQNLATARQVLAEFGRKLTARETAVEKFLLDLAVAQPKSFAEFYVRLRALPPSDGASLLRSLGRDKPDFYAFAVQSRLIELKQLNGKPSASLNQRAAAAMNRYCLRTGTPRFCSGGPMSAEQAEILGYSL